MLLTHKWQPAQLCSLVEHIILEFISRCWHVHSKVFAYIYEYEDYEEEEENERKCVYSEAP